MMEVHIVRNIPPDHLHKLLHQDIITPRFREFDLRIHRISGLLFFQIGLLHDQRQF